MGFCTDVLCRGIGEGGATTPPGFLPALSVRGVNWNGAPECFSKVCLGGLNLSVYLSQPITSTSSRYPRYFMRCDETRGHGRPETYDPLRFTAIR